MKLNRKQKFAAETDFERVTMCMCRIITILVYVCVVDGSLIDEIPGAIFP